MSSCQAPLRGPRDTYPLPNRLDKWCLGFGMILLDDRHGVRKHGDHASAHVQTIPLMYDKKLAEKLDRMAWTGQVSQYIHPAREINLGQLSDGVSMLITCTNDNEQVANKMLFRSEFTCEEFKQRVMTYARPGHELTILGDCPMTNADDASVNLSIQFKVQKNRITLDIISFTVDDDFFQKWVDVCTA